MPAFKNVFLFVVKHSFLTFFVAFFQTLSYLRHASWSRTAGAYRSCLDKWCTTVSCTEWTQTPLMTADPRFFFYVTLILLVCFYILYFWLLFKMHLTWRHIANTSCFRSPLKLRCWRRNLRSALRLLLLCIAGWLQWRQRQRARRLRSKALEVIGSFRHRVASYCRVTVNRRLRPRQTSTSASPVNVSIGSCRSKSVRIDFILSSASSQLEQVTWCCFSPYVGGCRRSVAAIQRRLFRTWPRVRRPVAENVLGPVVEVIGGNRTGFVVRLGVGTGSGRFFLVTLQTVGVGRVFASSRSVRLAIDFEFTVIEIRGPRRCRTRRKIRTVEW